MSVMAAEADEIRLQREYYAKTAREYDRMHNVTGKHEHGFALAVLSGLLDYLEIDSVLDIGSGTGRALAYFKLARPALRVRGIEPVAELRRIGQSEHGLSAEELVEGDAYALAEKGGEFDLVCALGVMHHLRHPARAIGEMLRVARKGIFISDANCFGQGRPAVRLVKQAINALRLWRAADFVKTRGKGYMVTQGDGLAYSYSLFDNYGQIRAACRRVHLINTSAGGINPYRSASHVAILGLKEG